MPQKHLGRKWIEGIRMTDRISKVAKLVLLLQDNPRISIRRIQKEVGLSRRTVYRYANEISAVMSVRIEKGVVVRDKNDASNV